MLQFLYEDPHCTGKTGEMVKNEIPVRENREFGNFAKTRDYICSSSKYPDSKLKIQDIAVFAKKLSNSFKPVSLVES